MSLFSLFAQRGCDQLAAIPPHERFTVHSRFQRTCNLFSSQGFWLTVLISGVPLPPLGLELSECELPDDLQPGSNWHWYEDVLQGPSSKIRLTGCKWQSTRLEVGALMSPDLLPSLARFLPHNPPEGGLWMRLYGDDQAYLMPALTGLADWFHCGDVTLSSALSVLLGYGQGLTPSGDDFLLGVLFALDLQGYWRRQQLVDAMLPLLARTTDISAVMLRQGAEGHYGELLQLLSTRDTSDDRVACAIKRVADYGHSSGHDMLCGILFVLLLLESNTRASGF